MPMVDVTPESSGPSQFSGERSQRIANYDREWSSFVDGIASRAGRGDSLAMLVGRYDAAVGKYDGFIAKWLRCQIARLDLGQFASHQPPQRLAVVNGRYVVSPSAPDTSAIFDAIARAVAPETDCIVEFGAGLGFNLARLRLRLPGRPISYIACEPSEHGRRAAAQLFSADPQAVCETRTFDYAEADLGFLGRFRHIVAFSAHSMEQIPVLGDAFYRALLGTNVAQCFHLEPVGWQRFTDIAETVMAFHREPQARRQFVDDYEFVVADSQLVTNAAMWSATAGYNTDLLPLIGAAAARGDVALTALPYEIVGINPFNPSTLIAWRRIGGAAGQTANPPASGPIARA
jgi:hypothetical protein